MKSIHFILWTLLIIFSGRVAAEATVIRLGILPFGTVNWELTALKNSGLAKSDSFRLEIQHIANPQAGKIALQAGANDVSRTADTGEMALAGKGFNPEVEKEFRKNSELNYEDVDQIEHYEVTMRERFSFVRDGGLSGAEEIK